MKNLLFIRIPSACICFTLITLATVFINLLSGSPVSSFPLILFGWIIACQIIDWMLSFINFKSWFRYCITESFFLYAGSLTVALLFDWMPLKAESFISFTLIFIIVDAFIFWYFRRRQKLLAEEINAML